jgi:hypothetical protein
LKKEGEYTDKVALSGFSLDEAETILHLLQRVRKNTEVDWEFVKKGNKSGDGYIIRKRLDSVSESSLFLIIQPHFQ